SILFYTFLVSLVVVLLLSVTSLSRSTPSEALRAAGTRATDSRAKGFRDVLVVSQVATSVLLLIASGLVLRSFRELTILDPGFRRDEILTSTLLLAGSSHEAPERQPILLRQIRENVGAIPGVRGVGLINNLPIGGDIWGFSYLVEGEDPPATGELPVASQRTVTPSYFETMEIPLLAGRDFSDLDDERAEPVVIVNRTLAVRHGSVETIVGRRIRVGPLDGEDFRTVVGVVSDSRQWNISDDIRPEIFFPYGQNPVSFYPRTTIVVASGEPPERLQPKIEDAVWSAAGEVPLVQVRTMERILRDRVAPRRFLSVLFATFASLALLLAAVGLYGVLSYTVNQQTVEIGIRAAFGATRADIGRLVLSRGAKLVVVGLLLGLGGAVLARGFLEGLLFGVSSLDPATFAAVSVFLVMVALVAVAIPARRAARLDPLRALRSE
ncbi:MAG TPA: FtsX-like permease family protein, partial [Vicinamibacteria bacterium]